MKAITNIFNNIQANSNNHSGLEATFLSEELGLDFIGRKTKQTKDNNTYKDINNINIEDYKVLFLQLSQPNFFGGVLGDDTIEKIEKISQFKGELYILCSDPRIKPINYAKVVFERFGVLQDCIQNWDNLLTNCRFVFPGQNLKRFFNSYDTLYNDDKVIKYDYFKGIFKKIFKYDNASYHQQLQKNHYLIERKLYNVVYYGDRRASYRQKLVKQYMPNNEDNLLIGFKHSIKDFKVPFIKKLKHADLLDKLKQCRVSLILADEEHDRNVITFRFYETLGSSCLAAIPLHYDPNKNLIQNKELKDLLYVKNQDDVNRIVENYSHRLVTLQNLELLRILDKIENPSKVFDFDINRINEVIREEKFDNEQRELWQ